MENMVLDTFLISLQPKIKLYIYTNYSYNTIIKPMLLIESLFINYVKILMHI